MYQRSSQESCGLTVSLRYERVYAHLKSNVRILITTGVNHLSELKFKIFSEMVKSLMNLLSPWKNKNKAAVIPRNTSMGLGLHVSSVCNSYESCIFNCKKIYFNLFETDAKRQHTENWDSMFSLSLDSLCLFWLCLASPPSNLTSSGFIHCISSLPTLL